MKCCRPLLHVSALTVLSHCCAFISFGLLVNIKPAILLYLYIQIYVLRSPSVLIHHFYCRLSFFLLVVFDVCCDAVSEVGGSVVVIEVDRVIAEVAYKVRSAAVDMDNEGLFIDKDVQYKVTACRVLAGAVVGKARYVIPVFFIELQQEVDVQYPGYFHLL